MYTGSAGLVAFWVAKVKEALEESILPPAVHWMYSSWLFGTKDTVPDKTESDAVLAEKETDVPVGVPSYKVSPPESFTVTVKLVGEME